MLGTHSLVGDLPTAALLGRGRGVCHALHGDGESSGLKLDRDTAPETHHVLHHLKDDGFGLRGCLSIKF